MAFGSGNQNMEAQAIIQKLMDQVSSGTPLNSQQRDAVTKLLVQTRDPWMSEDAAYKSYVDYASGHGGDNYLLGSAMAYSQQHRQNNFLFDTLGPIAVGALFGGATAGGAAGAGGGAAEGAAGAGEGLGAAAGAGAGASTGGTMGLTASDAAAGGTAATTAGGTTAGGTAASGGGMIDFSGFGSDFDASGFGGQQFDATGFGGDFSAGAFGGQQFDMTGWGSDFDAGTGIGDTSGLSVPSLGNLGRLWQWLNTKGGGIFGDRSPLETAGATVPGMLALAYANRQPGIDTGPLRDTMAAADVNAPLFTQAAIDPVQKNIAAGYGDLLQSQGLRNIRGSSFGNTDVANYLDTTGRTLGAVGATAAQKALGLRGDLASNLATLQAKAQEMKNNLYGRAFDTLGRGLNPKGYGLSIGGLNA